MSDDPGMSRNDDPKMSGMAWRATEVQAHMMAAPEPAPDPLQAHVEMIDRLTAERDALRAEVERLKRRHAALTAAYTAACDGWHECELKIEQLRKGVMPNAVTVRSDENIHDSDANRTSSADAVAGDSASAKTREVCGQCGGFPCWCGDQRPRKGVKDDGSNIREKRSQDSRLSGGDTGSDMRGRRLLVGVANPLDHRLGLPQADGEPVEPMSARPYRWLP